MGGGEWGLWPLCSGAIPTRIVYLSALEIIKSATSSVLHRYHLSDTANVGLASFIAGGGASLVAQSVFVPVDVVSVSKCTALCWVERYAFGCEAVSCQC